MKPRVERIDGNRCFLRHHRDSDAAEFVTWFRDPEMTGFSRHHGKNYTIDDFWSFFSQADVDASLTHFAVCRMSDAALVGTVLIRGIDQDVADVSVFVRKDDWGNGYGTEAVRLLVDYAIVHGSCRKITAGCHVRHSSSVTLFERAGFRKEGVRSSHVFFPGQNEYGDVLQLAKYVPRNRRVFSQRGVADRRVAVIEARMYSSRFPGKVLASWRDLTMLEIMIGRLRTAGCLDDVIVAATLDPRDDAIADACHRLRVKCHRGNETDANRDVLACVIGAAEAACADLIVELTADCPLIDPKIIDRTIEHFYLKNVDYVGNTCITSAYPRGVDARAFTLNTLKRVAALTRDPLDLENVSLFIYRHPEIFRLAPLPPPDYYVHPKTRLTVDYPIDHQVVCKILDELGPRCDLRDICEYFDAHPDVREMNGSLKVSYANDVDRYVDRSATL